MNADVEHAEQFAAHAANIRAARHMVARSLSGHDDVELAELLTAELSANAVEHAGTPFEVLVTRDGDGALTVEVHDDDATLPVLRVTGPDASRGRGLQLVNALAREWGITICPDDGKTVWFRLAPLA
jgi:two-component sensor histidine kinase